MDPLEKLAQKNRQHSEAKSGDDQAAVRYLPYMVLPVVPYIGLIYLMNGNALFVQHPALMGVVKLLWLLMMLLTFGIGAVCVIASLAVLLSVHLASKQQHVQVSFGKMSLFSASSLCFSYLCILLGNGLSTWIVEQRFSIEVFLSFGGDEPWLVFNLLTILLIALVSKVLWLFVKSIVALPFQAKETVLASQTKPD